MPLRMFLTGWFCFFLLHGLLSAKTPADIAKDVAPLVNESTFLVGYLDVKTLDPDKLTERGIVYLRRSLELFAFDDDSVRRSVDEGKKLLDDFARNSRQVLGTFREKSGIDEIYLIGFRTAASCRFFLATPLGKKSAEEKESLKKFLLELESTFVFRELNGFLLLPASSDPEEDGFDAYFNDFKPKELPKLADVFALCEGHPFRLAVLIPPYSEIEKPLRRFAEENGIESQIVNLSLMILNKLNDGVFGIDPLKPELKIVFRAKNASAAKQVAASLEGMIDIGVTAIQTVLFFARDPNDADEEMRYGLVPLVLEVVRGSWRMLLPNREDDKLLWSCGFAPETLTPEQAVLGGFLVLIGVSAYHEIREAEHVSKIDACSERMIRIVNAFHSYHEEKGTLPPEYSVDNAGKPLQSWRVLILPYLDEKELYDKIKIDEPWDSEHNKQFHQEMPAVFKCSSGEAGVASGLADYFVVSGEETAFFGSTPKKFDDIKDSLSKTIALVEWHGDVPSTWMDPTLKITFDDACKGSGVEDAKIGSKVIFFDGTIEFLPKTTESSVWKSYFTIAGNDNPDDDDEEEE